MINKNYSDFSKSEIDQWHPVVFFSRKMIPVKTQYKTYNLELLAIIETFKTWYYYLEKCKYEVFVFIDYNNLCQFINTKNLSFFQVC